MMKKVKALAIVMAVIALGVAACGSPGAGGMQVDGAWVRAVAGGEQSSAQTGHGNTGAMATPAAGEGSAMMGMNSAAYMTIANRTGSADRLLRVESDVAQAVELHQTQVENEVMTMRPVEAIDVPAGGQAVLEPGGLHIMLIGLKQPLTAGQRVTLTLVFEKAGSLTVDAEVRQP